MTDFYWDSFDCEIQCEEIYTEEDDPDFEYDFVDCADFPL